MAVYLVFLFVAAGAKLILAAVMIYLILPKDRECSQCSGQTLLLGGNRAARFRSRLFLGRIQRRWCPRCGWEGMTRRVTEDELSEDSALAHPSTRTERRH